MQEKPVTAAINGPATGGGLELALACDVRFAGEEATLGFREDYIGLIPGIGGCARLARLIGVARAKVLIFAGTMLPAKEALAIGLVNRVVPGGRLLDEARDDAQMLLKRAPQSLGLAKKILNSVANVDQTTAIVMEGLGQSILLRTEAIKRACGRSAKGANRSSVASKQMIIPYQGRSPKIAPNALVAPTAVLIGDVEIGEGASEWYGAVLRGDHGHIVIGRGSNVQDNATPHVPENSVTLIKDDVTIGHGAVLEGCTVESGALIGMNAVVLCNGTIGEQAILAAGSVATPRG